MFVYQIKSQLLSFPRFLKRALVVLSDSIAAIFTVWLGFGLCQARWSWSEEFLLVALIAAVISLPIFIFFGLYRAIFRYIGSSAFRSIVQAFILYSILFFSIFTLIGVGDVPRAVGVMQPVLYFICIGMSRYFVRHWLGKQVMRSGIPIATYSSVLIYGAGSAGRQLAKALSTSNEFSVLGFIDDETTLHGQMINGVQVFSINELESLVSRYQITDILLATPSISQKQRNEIIAILSNYNVRVRTLPSLLDIASGRARISDLQDLDMNDLLGRDAVPPDVELMKKNVFERVILITGAGGSIGSELCRQIIKLSPKALVLVDCNEHALYLIYEELKKIISAGNQPDLTSTVKVVPCLASVTDREIIQRIFKDHDPYLVFHAAAYKHVPLVEQNPVVGLQNNVFGTLNCSRIALECATPYFVLVSTDKAVRPTNVMGASKRIAELILQAMNEYTPQTGSRTLFSMVRFGNVLGSSGSVVPLFNSQIQARESITLTHPDVTRYFMTIPEAAQLVIQSNVMAIGGDVFILDMGEPIRIYDLAVRIIHLSGLRLKNESNPQGDIEIKVTGLRPGEKLYEELLIGDNPQPTYHPKIMKAHESFLPWNELELSLAELEKYLRLNDMDLVRSIIKKMVPGYLPEQSIH